MSPLHSWDGENHSAMTVHKSDSQNVPLLHKCRGRISSYPWTGPCASQLCFTVLLLGTAELCWCCFMDLLLLYTFPSRQHHLQHSYCAQEPPRTFHVGLEKGMMSPHYTLLTSLARAGISFYPPMFCDSEGKKNHPEKELFLVQWDPPKPLSSCATVGIVRTGAIILYLLEINKLPLYLIRHQIT